MSSDLRPGAEDFGIRRQADPYRLSDPPEARAAYLSGSVLLVTKAVERACHIDSMMLIHKQFFYQTVGEDGEVITALRHGAFVFLYNPLSGIVRTLKSIDSNVNRYAWLIKRLKIVGNSELKMHLDSGEHTDVEKLYQLKLYLDLYQDVEKKPYSDVFHKLINQFDSSIAEIETLISLLSSIWEEGNRLPVANTAPTNSPADAMITDSNAVDLESEGNGAVDSNVIDLEDESKVETEGDKGPGSPQSQSGSTTPTPTNPGARAPTHGYAESYWSETSTVRPRLPSPPSPYRRTPSPKLFDYASQSPPPTLPRTGFGYSPLPQFPRTPSPPPDPRTPSWKIYLSKKYRIEELYVTERDLTIFGEALRLAHIALREMQRVQRVCVRLDNWYWRANESYAEFKKMYVNADPELVEQVWEHLEMEKEGEERKKSESQVRKQLGLGAVGAGKGKRSQLETVVEEDEVEEDVKTIGEEMELEEELGLEGEDEIDMDDEEAQLAHALDQIAAMEAREAGQPASLTAATSRFSLDE